MNPRTLQSHLSRIGWLLLPVLSSACMMATDADINGVEPEDVGASTEALTSDGKINVLLIGNSQLAFGPENLELALEAYSASVNGGSNNMNVTLRQHGVST
ncbi:MAG TPA: hypothetical protein VJR89_18400, partial [Polyangiales bacterium]|nr:hypothetical protein [Polyangiales bacterium]